MSTGIGEALRSAREEQGRDLEDAARVLRVRTDYLHALEEERFDAFGGDVYAKGFLRSYASELGMDPEPLLDIYRREISQSEVSAAALVTDGAGAGPPSPRRAPPAWVAWIVVIAVVLGGLGLLGVLGDTTPEQADPDGVEEPPPDSAGGAGEQGGGDNDGGSDGDQSGDGGEGDGDGDGDGEGGETDPSSEDGSDGEGEAAVDGVALMLAFEEASWLRVVVDGTPLVEETVEAGETRQFEGEREIEVRFGNAGGVRVEHNGEDLGSPGARGEVLDVTFREDEVEGIEG